MNLRTCHDVRFLVVCQRCHDLADGRNLVRGKHGRCFIAAHGLKAFLALPQHETDGVTLDDVGADVMARLLVHARRRRRR